MGTMNDDEDMRVELLDERIEFSFTQLCHLCRVDRALIEELVDEGFVEPAGREPAEWRFSGYAVARVRRVLRLQREFEINLHGALLAFDLLEEIDRLRRGRG
jgi:chaperone modulatory protein CbpM